MLMGKIDSYVEYDKPKIGLFKVETGKWGKNGWERKEVRDLIIGETDIEYVTRFIISKGFTIPYSGEVVPDKKISLGYHKSRLIKWLN